MSDSTPVWKKKLHDLVYCDLFERLDPSEWSSFQASLAQSNLQEIQPHLHEIWNLGLRQDDVAFLKSCLARQLRPKLSWHDPRGWFKEPTPILWIAVLSRAHACVTWLSSNPVMKSDALKFALKYPVAQNVLPDRHYDSVESLKGLLAQKDLITSWAFEGTTFLHLLTRYKKWNALDQSLDEVKIEACPWASWFASSDIPLDHPDRQGCHPFDPSLISGIDASEKESLAALHAEIEKERLTRLLGDVNSSAKIIKKRI